MKSTRLFAAALLLTGGAVVFSAAPAYAEEPVNEGVCAGLDSGKIDVEGDVKVITITAPEGYLITGYCVKAGSIKQGNGPEYVELETPVESIDIDHSSGKDISHYSFSYTEKTHTTPPTTTTPVHTDPAGGGDGGGKHSEAPKGGGEQLAETGFDNGWLLFAGLGAMALGGAIAAPRIAAAKRR